MNAELSIKFLNILPVVDNVKKEVKACAGQITQAEVHISGTEDNIIALQETTTSSRNALTVSSSGYGLRLSGMESSFQRA